MATPPGMRCALCGTHGTTKRKVVKHHYRSRRLFPSLTMPVHDGSCHDFANFVTKYYLEKGVIEQLYPRRVVYLFNRCMSLRDGHKLVFEELT